MSTPAPAPAPAVHTDPYENYKLPIEGFKGTPEEIERQWFEQCYKGRGDSMWQLTWRAVIMGSVLGGLLSVTNIYIGLKAGWGFGVSITACILSYAIWTTIYKLGLARTPMTILENNCMQTAASAAGYSTGGTLISAFAAYMMLEHTTIPTLTLMGFVFFLAVLGVTMAVPMKRTMINVEQLRFPSGVAAAETLKALHGTSSGGMGAAIALGVAGLLAILNKIYYEGLSLFSKWAAPYEFSGILRTINERLFGQAWMHRTVQISWELMFVAAGAITGLRVSTSMLIGGITCWMIYIPWLQGTIDPKTGSAFISAEPTFREAVQWSLWGGTACMVTSGLLSFGMQWKSALRAFAGMGSMFTGKHAKANVDPVQAEIDAMETPAWWFLLGQLVGLVGLSWMGLVVFGIPIWQTVVAVLLSFALALVACRVTGETDTTPIGALGKVTQLAFGAMAPGNTTVNLMAANTTAGAAGSSAALLTDLKSGYLLGAHPRKQFLAQFSGIFVGTLMTVLIFKALVPDPGLLGTEKFPAPAAVTWKAVAEALGHGINQLHHIKVWAIVIGGIIGLVLPILTMLVPPKVKPWIPSAAGVGFGWVFQWYYAFLFFVGAVIAWVLEKGAPKWSGKYLFAIASGWIAGETLTGVAIELIRGAQQ